MKKKGFTLVELLAVIVILAIIALIAIPLIGNVIEKAKIGALESSVNGLVESANMYYANNAIKGEAVTETTFDFGDGEQISNNKLEYKGKVYNGKLILHANGEVAVCIDDEEHYAYKNKDTDEIVSGNGTCLYDGTTGDFSSNSPLEDLKQQIAAATATADKVLEGNTIYTSVGLVAGTMTNKSGTTTAATTITENGDNALITIPANGYYSTSSKISVPIETIQNEIDILSTNIDYFEFTVSKTEQYTFNLGYKPRVLFWQGYADDGTLSRINAYFENWSITSYFYYDQYASSGAEASLGTTTSYRLYAINDDGTLVFNKFPNFPNVKLWAIK